MAKEFTGKIADVAALNQRGINVMVINQFPHDPNNMIFQSRVFPHAKFFVTLVNKIRIAFANKRRHRLRGNVDRFHRLHGRVLQVKGGL